MASGDPICSHGIYMVLCVYCNSQSQAHKVITPMNAYDYYRTFQMNEGRVVELEKTIILLEEQLEEYRIDVAGLKEELSRVKEERDNFEKDIEALEEEKESLQNDLEEAAKQLSDEESEKEAWEDEAGKYENQTNDLRDEIEELEERLENFIAFAGEE